MLRRPALLLVSLLLLTAACAPRRAPGPDLQNLTDAKQAVVAYHTDGRYEADVAAVARAARDYVSKRLEEGVSGRPAVVFDIHQTLLDVFGIEREMQFGFFRDTWDRRIAQADLPPIRPVVQLWEDLRARGVALFLVTNTEDKHRDATEANLRAAGVTGWAHLYMRPDEAPKSLSAQDYKTGVRAALEAEGYRILVSVGDQTSDLAGGHAEQGFKLPNYMWRLN